MVNFEVYEVSVL